MSKPIQQNSKGPQTLTKQKDRQIIAEQQTVAFSGPIPHPVILKQYDQAVPGAAERIITMTEEQAKHRMQLENKAIESGINREKRGQIFAVTVALAGLLVTTIMGIWGNPWIAGGVGFLSLGSLVGVFLYGSHQQQEERKQRRQELETE